MSLDEDEITRRKRMADYYFDNYMKHYKDGNLSKASEFLWGSINNLAFCLGILDNLKLSDHGKVKGYITSLATLRKDQEIIDGLEAAETIHANFYHNFMSKENFDHQRVKAEKLANTLGLIFSERMQKIVRSTTENE